MRQNNAVQEYFDKYVTTPDYNLGGDMNSHFFYQEGGFSKFYPVAPGGMYLPKAQEGAPPEQGQHALWNSVSQNLQGLGRIALGNRELKSREAQNKIDNELGYARLELAKQQLSQQDAQFKISTAFEQMRMSNTIFDKLNDLELPAYREDQYKAIIAKPGGIAQSMSDYQTATDSNDPEAQARAATKLYAAMNDPEIVQFAREKKRDDSMLNDLKTAALMDPLILQYKNVNEVSAAIVSGQKPPELTWIDSTSEAAYNQAKIDERLNTEELRKQNILLSQAKTEQLKAEATLKTNQGKESELEQSILNEKLTSIDNDPKYTTPSERAQAKLDAYREFNTKAEAQQRVRARAASGGGGNSVDSMYEQIAAYQAQGYTLDRARQMAHEDESYKHNANVNYSGQVLGLGGGGPQSQQAPTTSKLATNILDATNHQANTWGTLQQADRTTVSTVVNTNKPNYTFRLTTDADKNPLPAFGSPAGIKVGPDERFYATDTRVNADGRTVSVKGVIKTTSEEVARSFGYKGAKDANGDYVIPVTTETPKGDLGLSEVNTTPGKTPANTTSSTSSTSSGPIEVVTAPSGKHYMKDSSGKLLEVTDAAYKQGIANGSYKKKQ